MPDLIKCLATSALLIFFLEPEYVDGYSTVRPEAGSFFGLIHDALRRRWYEDGSMSTHVCVCVGI